MEWFIRDFIVERRARGAMCSLEPIKNCANYSNRAEKTKRILSKSSWKTIFSLFYLQQRIDCIDLLDNIQHKPNLRTNFLCRPKPNHKELENEKLSLTSMNSDRSLTSCAWITCVATFGNVMSTFTTWCPGRKILNRSLFANNVLPFMRRCP